MVVMLVSAPFHRSWPAQSVFSCGAAWLLRSLVAVLAAVLVVAGTTSTSVYAANPGQQSPGEGRDAAEYYEQALVAYNLGELRSAYLRLKDALEADPFLLSARLLLGKVFLGLGHGERAEKELLLADGLGAHRSLIQIPLARAYLLQGKTESVISELLPIGDVPGQDAELLALRGQAHMEQGEYFDAQRAFDEAAQRNPRSVTAMLGRVQVMLRQAELSAAAEVVRKAVAVAPRDPRAWYLKGVLARTFGDMSGALEDFSKAAAILPAHFPTQVERIGLLMQVERLDEAAEIVAKLRTIYPRDARALYLQATIKARQGDLKGAEADLKEAEILISQFPRELIENHAPTLLIAGMVAYSLKRWEWASEYLNRYLSLNPNSTGTRLLLGQLLLDQRQPQAAINVVEPVLDTDRGDVRVYSLLAEAYMQEGYFLKASNLLNNAVDLESDNWVLKAQRAVSRFGLGLKSDAIDELGGVFDARPDLESAGATLIVMLLKKHRFAEALEKARRLVAVRGANLTYVNLLGVSALAAGNYPLAEWAFDLVLAIDSEFEPAHINRAELALRQRKPELAQQRLERLFEFLPEQPAGLILMARAAEARGDDEQARRLAEKALGLDDAGLPVVVYLTELLLKTKQAPAALRTIESFEFRAPNRDNVELLVALGRAYLENNRPSTAQTVLRRASTFAGSDARKLIRIAKLQRSAGDLDGSLWSLDKAVRGEPEFLPARIALGELQIELNMFDPAEKVAEALKADFPDAPYGYHLMGAVHRKVGRFDLAVQSYLAALERQSSPVLAVRAYDAKRRSESLTEAVTFLELWLEEHRGDSVVEQALAEGYFRLGNWDQARQLYEKALDADTDNALVLNNLALLYARQGDPQAEQFARKAQAMMPIASQVNDTLGWVLVNSGQASEGLRFLRDARSRAIANPAIGYHIADALHRLGRTEEAIAELQGALSSDTVFDEREDAESLLAELQARN